MDLVDEEVCIKKVEVELNKKILLIVLVVTGFSIILSGCLAYVFSDSIYTIFFSLLFGITLGVLINYFIIVSNKIVANVNVEIVEKEDSLDDLQTVMKIE